MIITINTEGSLVREVQYDSWPNLTEFCSFLFLFVRSNMRHSFLLSPLWIHLEALLCVQAAKSNFDHPDLLPYGNWILQYTVTVFGPQRVLSRANLWLSWGRPSPQISSLPGHVRDLYEGKGNKHSHNWRLQTRGCFRNARFHLHGEHFQSRYHQWDHTRASCCCRQVSAG